MSYDLTPYVAVADERWLRARVTWTPHGGDTTTAIGDYVDGMGGTASLGCGIEELLDDLRLPQFEDTEHYLAVCDLVNRQLAQRPWAVLVCPEGVARLELSEVR